MELKEFLRPTIKKLILTLGLFFVISFIWSNINVVLDAWFFGYPSAVIGADGFCPPVEVDPDCGKPQFFLDGIVIDAVFFYILSCLLVLLFQRGEK